MRGRRGEAASAGYRLGTLRDVSGGDLTQQNRPITNHGAVWTVILFALNVNREHVAQCCYLVDDLQHKHSLLRDCPFFALHDNWIVIGCRCLATLCTDMIMVRQPYCVQDIYARFVARGTAMRDPLQSARWARRDNSGKDMGDGFFLRRWLQHRAQT